MFSYQENVSLLPFNTFHMDVKARFFAEINTLQDLMDGIQSGLIAQLSAKGLLVLGGGSNLLFTKDFKGLVLAIRNKGIESHLLLDGIIEVKAAAGENWHEFVKWCVEKDFGGIENLSLIPGNVGSCPIQNIGAYGVEVKDVIKSVEALNLHTGEIHVFTNHACRFAYRESIFKLELKGTFVIWSVTFNLSTKPEMNLGYGAIKQELEKMNISVPGIDSVSEAVIRIRNSKLPDPDFIGNAGSFFKNPTIEKSFADMLLAKFPNLVCYAAAEGKVKLAAGWLIEHCGWKGKRLGDAGVHETQSLVLVNYGSASGLQILDLATKIQNSVLKEFGIQLEMEVNVV